MLQGHLALHDVTDVEKLAARALTDALRTMRATLNPTDHEDALAYLIATAWELSLRYDPNRGWSFSKLAYRTLRLRVVDWYRDRYWDTRHAKPELPISLDAPIPSADTGDPRAPGLGSLVASGLEDHRPASGSDLVRSTERRTRRGNRLFSKTARQDAERAA